jgi:hypothetical protein
LKKTSTLNEVTISSNTLIDNSSSYLLTSSNTGYIRLASTGSSWVALSTSEAKPWEPSELSQIIGWYDASDASTITEAGGFVSAWQDKSGLDNHLTQSDANAQPQTETESINQLNAIDFDHTGTYDALETSNNPFGANISDAMIIFTATATDTSLKTQFSLSGNADAASRWQTHINRPSGETLFDVGGTNEGVGTRLTVPTDYSTGDNILMAFYVSTTESKQEVYSAGNLLSPTSTGRAVSTAGNILIGSTSNEGSSINYGEVIILNGTVSSDERQLLEGYLANKWGLKSLFQEDHPFNLI